MGTQKQFEKFLTYSGEENTPEVFVFFCGVIGLGKIAATLAEPRLLKNPRHAKQVLQILDKITASMVTDNKSTDDSCKVLRQGMGYCWSVAVAALPDVGKAMMERWLSCDDYPPDHERKLEKESPGEDGCRLG